MSPIYIKIKKIILPFLLVSFATLIAYMLIYWVMDVTNILDRAVGVNFVNIWLLLILPLISTIAFMRSRMRLLKVGNAYAFYMVIVYLVMLGPLEYAGDFIAKAGRGLTQVSTIDDLEQGKLDRYYKIDNYKLVTRYLELAEWTVTTNNKLVYTKAIPIPMVADSANVYELEEFKYFFAKEYDYPIEKKDDRLMNYLSYWDAMAVDNDSIIDRLASFVPDRDCYFERLLRTGEYDFYKEALDGSVYKINGSPQILRPIYEPFHTRYYDDLYLLLKELVMSLLLFLFMVWVPKLDVKEYRRQYKPFHNVLDEDDEAILQARGLSQFFVPKKGSLVITPILIDINVLMYVMLIIAGYSPYGLSTGEAYAFGANSLRGVSENGEIWRLITYAFLHNDVVHLFSNMLLLAAGGAIVERYMGKWVFLLLYFVTAFLAGAFSMSISGFEVSVGASGAIMGVYGAMLGLAILKMLPDDKRVNFVVAFYMLINGVILNTSIGIDVAAHYGGFFIGFVGTMVIGAVVRNQQKYTYIPEVDGPIVDDMSTLHYYPQQDKDANTTTNKRERGRWQRRSNRRRARRTGQRRNDMTSYDRSHRRPRRRIGKRNEHR